MKELVPSIYPGVMGPLAFYQAHCNPASLVTKIVID
jgi:hypothetical protein